MIRFGALAFHEEERNAILDIINSNPVQLTMGKRVYEFERAFAGWLGARFAVMVNSGTSALMVALSAFNHCVGYRPLTATALTYPAVWNALHVTCAPYRIRDVEDDFVVHGDDSPSEHLAVHLLGKPCRANAAIEDVSEAMGTRLNGNLLGTSGLMSTFSFYVNHPTNTIEGGMVATNDEQLYECCRSLRDNGRVCTCPVCSLKLTGTCAKRQTTASQERRWDRALDLGFNFKPTDIQGALGLVKMRQLKANFTRRNEIFMRYAEAFGNFTQAEDEYIVSIAYPVRVRKPAETVVKLEKVGVEARGMFPAYNPWYPKAYELSQSHVLLPLHQEMSDADTDFVIEKVKGIMS